MPPTETKWTKTPWTYSAYRASLKDADGNLIGLLSTLEGEAIDPKHASMIEAAPELYEALSVIATQSIGPDWTHEQAFAFMRYTARSAIRKAKQERK